MSVQPLEPEIAVMFAEAIKQVTSKDFGALRPELPIAELGLDSVTVIEMVGVLEDRLGVRFNDDDLSRINTFGDLRAMVKKYQAAKAA
jgi:acyl carrier protein